MSADLAVIGKSRSGESIGRRHLQDLQPEGAAVLTTEIPAAEAGRGVVVTLCDLGEAFQLHLSLEDGTYGSTRWQKNAPVASTVSDNGHWAVADELGETGAKIAITTEREHDVRIMYSDRAWLALIAPLKRDLHLLIEERTSRANVRTRREVTLLGGRAQASANWVAFSKG